MGKHNAGTAAGEPVLTEITAGDDQAQSDALWTIRHAITGRRQTVTTTELNQLLRDETVRIFDVTPVPLTDTAAA